MDTVSMAEAAVSTRSRLSGLFIGSRLSVEMFHQAVRRSDGDREPGALGGRRARSRRGYRYSSRFATTDTALRSSPSFS